MFRTYEHWPNRSNQPNAADSSLISTARQIANDWSRQGYDLTLRQLYYQFVAHHGLPNNDKSYKRLGDVINKARLAGLFDWNLLVDRTRYPQLPSFWSSPTEILRSAARGYNTDKRADQPVHVEVWVEKEALAQIASTATARHDVPSFSCRGYTSASAMWRGAQRLGEELRKGKAVRIIHLGDHDPSGIDMTRDITDRLERFITMDWLHDMMSVTKANWFDIYAHMQATLLQPAYEPFKVERIALNMDQIEEYEPPPNPAKVSDSRAAEYISTYGTDSWELDALAPDVLVAMIRERIEHYTDDELLAAQQEREDGERAALDTLIDRWDDVRDFLGV